MGKSLVSCFLRHSVYIYMQCMPWHVTFTGAWTKNDEKNPAKLQFVCINVCRRPGGMFFARSKLSYANLFPVCLGGTDSFKDTDADIFNDFLDPRHILCDEYESQHCRWTRATRCPTPIVLYTKVDAHGGILATVVVRLPLTTPATLDVPYRIFFKSRVRGKVPKAIIFIFGDAQIPFQ